jgi:hypothetical protein
VQDLPDENKDLKELTKTRIIVSRVNMIEEPRVERKVAEACQIDMLEPFSLENLQETYDATHPPLNDGKDHCCLKKLENTDAWTGSFQNFDDQAYVVRLDKGNSSTVLGVYFEGNTTRPLTQNCIECNVVFLDTKKTSLDG